MTRLQSIHRKKILWSFEVLVPVFWTKLTVRNQALGLVRYNCMLFRFKFNNECLKILVESVASRVVFRLYRNVQYQNVSNCHGENPTTNYWCQCNIIHAREIAGAKCWSVSRGVPNATRPHHPKPRVMPTVSDRFCQQITCHTSSW